LADEMVELEYVEEISHETVRDAFKKTKLNLGKKKNGVSLPNPMQNSFARWKKS